MKPTISQLKSTDIEAVDELMKHNIRTLGFLTKETLLDGFIKKGGALGAKTDDGQLVGYLLFAAYTNYFRIAQLCVSEDSRDQGIAKQLVESLKNSVTTQKVIKLHCRRDSPADKLWPRLGFVASGEKPGRSKEGHLLTHWCLTLAEDDQLKLFQAKTSDDTLDVIIDAQIFFDFDEIDSDKSEPSKELLSDFFIDSLNLRVTDELFNEINRNSDLNQRIKSRNRAQNFFPVEPEPRLVENFDEILRKILPDDRPNQESDIRQLAKAAASDINTFVTRDQALLKNAKKISELTKLQVLSPNELIIQLHELSERQSYTPTRVSGFSLKWDRLKSGELADFPFDSFLVQGERKGNFREKLNVFLAKPNQYKCEILWLKDKAIALRVLTNSGNKILAVPFSRVSSSADSLFEIFLIVDTIYKAVEKNLSMVKFEKASLTLGLKSDLLMMGFTECNDSFMRFCFSRCLDQTEILSEIATLCPESKSNYQNMSDNELERHCSPLNLGNDQNYFLIPIRSDYARSLINSYQSADDLFGGNTRVLLRWDNVYYRKKNRHKMLVPPGRILWYVSEREKQIVAVSHLDEVEIGIPQELFKKFKRFGILEWEDLYKMCGCNTETEIMALKFSHTFPFRQPISLETIRTVFKEDKVGLSLQPPSKIPTETFRKLFYLGYPNQI
ncbi:MAG: GNAT family N-acetyltransferase [Candidatus Latescibacteria bacterium]|nr:GNAT family N-acetyltransferase [Candidatus Latescibacterota bacterium]